MSETESELKNIVEAALLAAEEPLSVAALTALFPDDAAPSADQLREVFEQLEQDYAGRGVELKRVGKGYRFQSREKYSPWLRKLHEQRAPRYGRAFLETLAIIAYRQPVTRGDIEEIRGVSVGSEIMRGLRDRGWVRQVGQRDVPGRPNLYGTTRQFLEYFNLEALSALPPLLERRESAEIARELNLQLPLEETDAGASETSAETSGTSSGDPQAVDTAADPSDNGDTATEGVEETPPRSGDQTHNQADNQDYDQDYDQADSEASNQERDHDQGLDRNQTSNRGRDQDHDQHENQVGNQEHTQDRDQRGNQTGNLGRDQQGAQERDSTPRRTAQIISIDDALASKEGDGETS